jgi:hypothetical protein
MCAWHGRCIFDGMEQQRRGLTDIFGDLTGKASEAKT